MSELGNFGDGQAASDEELGLKERLKRQQSRAGRKGPRGCGKNNHDLIE
jgi:hypothetical protein